MKKYLWVKLVLFFFVVSVALIAVPQSSSAQTKLNYSNFWPAPHKMSIIQDQWCKEVEKRTNGKVKITYYPGGTLTPAAQTFDSVKKGITDLGCTALAYTPGRFPLMEVIDLPLGYKTGVAATNLANEVFAKFQPKEFGDVKVLYFHAHGPGILHTKTPVAKLEDVKGMKIRATGLAAKVVGALGGAPVGTTMGETYDALRTGVAQGAMAPIEALQGWKWGEVVGSTTQNFSSAYTTTFVIAINKSKWNALPADVKKAMDDVSKEWVPKIGKLWDEIDKEGYAFTKKRGNKIIALSKDESAKWAKAVKPLLDDYVKNAKAKGVPGDQALKFALDYLAKYDK